MRVLFIGGIVGESGRKVVTQNLLRIRDKYKLDFAMSDRPLDSFIENR